jgi:hypothetical protein
MNPGGHQPAVAAAGQDGSAREDHLLGGAGRPAREFAPQRRVRGVAADEGAQRALAPERVAEEEPIGRVGPVVAPADQLVGGGQRRRAAAGLVAAVGGESPDRRGDPLARSSALARSVPGWDLGLVLGFPT